MQKRHTVDLTTNLSFDVDYFLKMIDPENIKISASFHPQFVSFDEFLKKIVILKDRAYHLSVCFVTYPPFLEKMDEFKKAIEGRGIMFNISPFDGVFNGKKYPQAYTDAERDILRRITDEAFLSDSTNQKRYEWKVEKIRNMKGRLCRMGQMYAKILPNGEVTRCCVPTSGKLGNILDENFRLLDAPKPCQVESVCPCFKAMLVGEEGHWLSMWGVAGALSVQRENT
jgi:MoaA/NifB/PqqE/SkfB family radical SAM enzyme